MFTQCPECSTAFRVTADVLKKAAGQVRCGGCGIAFNALEHLSEDMPSSAPRAQPHEHEPELTPETNDDRDSQLPKSISAERSAALLKTLDELAGSDIQIEDTGVEWRVLDEESEPDETDFEEERAAESQLIADTGTLRFVLEDDEDDVGDASDIFASPAATVVDSNLEQDSGRSVIDEFLTESPTPVDQFLTATPSEVDSPEVFSEAAPEVMRFDDNTPLPDDFDLGAPTPYVPDPPAPLVERRAPAIEMEDAQVDLAFGEPDEWEQLLGEVDEPAEEAAVDEENDAPADEAAEQLDIAVAQEATETEDSTAYAADTPPDMDTQFAIQAEAMGIDLSGMHKVVDDDVDDHEEAAADNDEAADLPIDDIADDDESLELELSAEEDNELDAALEKEVGELFDEDDLDEDSDGEDLDEDDLDEEPELAVDASDDELIEDELTEDEFEDDDADATEIVSEEEDDLDYEDATVIQHEEDDEEDEELALLGEADDDQDDASIGDADDAQPQTSIDEDLLAAAFESEAEQKASEPADEPTADPDDDSDVSGEHYVPPQTEEEMTINMMIDQDFMRLAAEGEDIFTATTVEDRSEFDDNPNVETIIMEGDFVRTALDREKLAADAAAGSRRFDDARFSSKPAGDPQPGVRGGRRAGDPVTLGTIAGIMLLALLLAAQFLHQSREALATVPAVNQAIAPIYRTIGRPLTPAWDVTGWRFEVSKGNTDEAGESLTIYSRVGNNSEKPLPYPLLHISLTDRFDEIIGSKVLEPREYLAGDPDPRKAVEPGETFNAVISIESPAPETAGFKLNVCYRLADRQLRCSVQAFK